MARWVAGFCDHNSSDDCLPEEPASPPYYKDELQAINLHLFSTRRTSLITVGMDCCGGISISPFMYHSMICGACGGDNWHRFV